MHFVDYESSTVLNYVLPSALGYMKILTADAWPGGVWLGIGTEEDKAVDGKSVTKLLHLVRIGVNMKHEPKHLITTACGYELPGSGSDKPVEQPSLNP